MKKYLCLLFFLLELASISAQKGQTDLIRELGFNVIFMTDQFRARLGNNFEVEGYAFSFKRIKGKNAFRTAFGMNLNDRLNDGLADGYITGRVGYERRFLIEKRFLINTGIDFVFDMANGSFNFGRFRSRPDFSFQTFLGLEYRINDYLSLSTEANLFYVFTPVHEIGIIMPRVLFLSFRFNKKKKRKL